MNLNDLGNFCVVFLVANPARGHTLCHAFFKRQDDAMKFIGANGGELYNKYPDGTLKRA